MLRDHETHLSAARDEHLLGFGVMGERGVNEGLVVDVFVRLGALHEPVGDEQTAEGLGLDHLHGLELGLALVEHLVNPVGDSEAILEDLVVPVALVEDVAADAARVSHGTCKYVCARLQMCQDGQTVNSPPPPIAGTDLHPVLVILWAIIIRVYLPQMHTQANMQDEHNCNGECPRQRKSTEITQLPPLVTRFQGFFLLLGAVPPPFTFLL
mmetsp:Transcript_8302/g.37367  ORF Transcript_8302/g.37367 Transcript_8302/m.37367 type:complete len:211 (+) Transcript_8302:10085-10717(+)